jgi:hypothetical protein
MDRPMDRLQDDRATMIIEMRELKFRYSAAKSERLKFARERYAEAFADEWRRRLWSAYYDHPDLVHNGPSHD